MKLSITSRKMTVRDSLEKYLEKRMSKLDKFFDDNVTANVTISAVREMVSVEVTIRHDGVVFRAEDVSEDGTEAIDNIVDVLVRQIRKNKTKLKKRISKDEFFLSAIDTENGEIEDLEFNVVRNKKFPLKPMDIDEAILQMNLIGHSFFMFMNMDTDQINVVYVRNDGDYGLLEPEV